MEKSKNKYLIKNILFSNKLNYDINDKYGPGKFLNDFLGYKAVNPIKFHNDFKNNLSVNLHKLNNLFWQIIILPPYTNFSYHIHPNIEYDYVAEGKLYEIRGIDIIDPNILSNHNNIHKIMEKLSIENFEHRVFEKDNALINQAGSFHLSYTKKERCVIFALWSGNEIKIDVQPPFFKSLIH